ncbi:ATP-binding protein [Arenimonas sp.]|uniref:ATP-binding protein n=1 Tax=Arenimonas sp. TaxID=1872635 RepID=UPI0035B10C9D
MSFRRSLRLRLLLVGLAGVAVAALLLALWLGQAFREASQRTFDRELQEELHTLLVALEADEQGRIFLQAEPEDQHYAQPLSGHYWWVMAGDLQFRSRSVWDAQLQLTVPTAPGPAQVLEMPGPRDTPLRAMVQAVAFEGVRSPVVVVVAADRTLLEAEAAQFRWLAGGAVALVTVCLLLLLALQMMFALRPLTKLADTANRVRRGATDRFPEKGLPSEVAPLARHLNELLDHHDRSVRRARTAAQDLAHALKTPLSVLSLEAAHPGEKTGEVVAEQVARMHASVDRHLGRGVAIDQRGRTPVAPVVDALLALMRRVHDGRGLRFERLPGDDLVFAGSREDLEEMLGNLLDNAGKWARSCVRVAWGASRDSLWLEVRDDGPGLPESEREQALARGVRMDQRQPGSGLGLAIASDLAEGYGGRLVLGPVEPSGLCARLELPAA